MLATDKYKVLEKPHGHGDVHLLLHQSGLAKKWHDAGKKWVVFFQVTSVSENQLKTEKEF